MLKKNFNPVYKALEEVNMLSHKVATVAHVKAKKYVPVDTGRLKKSIQISSDISPYGGEKYSVYTNQDYAQFVEYGSSTNRPRFFMKKAALDAEVVMSLGLTDIKRRLL
jgi:HK97 gp10 family phage protein